MDEIMIATIEGAIADVNARWAWVGARYEERGYHGAFVVGRRNDGTTFEFMVWEDDGDAMIDGERVALDEVAAEVDMTVNALAFA